MVQNDDNSEMQLFFPLAVIPPCDDEKGDVRNDLFKVNDKNAMMLLGDSDERGIIKKTC